MPELPNVWNEPFQQELIDTLRLEASFRFRKHQLPETLEAWKKRRPVLRRKFLEAMKVTVDHQLPLEMSVHGEIDRGNYVIRKITFQTRPGIHTVAALYIPKGQGDGPFPAILNLHGHWPNGHLAPNIQKRGHIFAQRGYVVLSPDAFGAGERAREEGAKGEYHGGVLGGCLMNVDETLIGCQLIDNMRAVDLLESLPFVDRKNIGCTGASGGGNQTMYAAAFDERIKAAMPVVSAGSFQSYIGGCNCICEVIPGGLDIGEESAILALTAPRALCVANAFHDPCPAFFPKEAARSVSEARKVYRAYNANTALSSPVFNTTHGFWPEIQSHALGFFDFYLKKKGHGLPAELPEYTTLTPEEMLTFPVGTRPAKVMTIPRFIRQKAAMYTEQKNAGTPAELQKILRIGKKKIVQDLDHAAQGEWEKHTIEDESGRLLPFLFLRRNSGKCRILVSPAGKKDLPGELLDDVLASGESILIFDQWGTGEYAPQAEDYEPHIRQHHNFARALLWLNRRLMGEWTADWLLAFAFIRKELKNADILVQAYRDSAVAALFAAAIAQDSRISLQLHDAPQTLVMGENSPDISHHFTLAMCIPGIIPWGDLARAQELVPGEVRFIAPHSI